MMETSPGSPDFNTKDAGASFDHEIETMFETPAPAPAEPAPTPPAPAEERPAEQAESGPPRDDKGRFAQKAAPPVEQPAAPTAPAPAAPQAPTATTEPAAIPPAETPLPEASYRADGKDFTIPGSKMGEDGVFIPTEQWDGVQRLIGQGQVHQGSFQRRLSESAQSVQREKTRADAAEASKQAVFDKLMAMAKDGTIGNWIDENLVQNLEVLLARSEAEGQKLRVKEYEEREAARDREAAEAARGPQMENALANAILHFGGKAGLTDARMQQLYARLNQPEFRRALYSEATEDDPINGIRKGETVIALGLIEQEVAWAGPGTTQPATDKVAAAAAANAKAGVTAVAPPTVGARGGPAPGTKTPPKQFKNAAEADDHIWGEGFRDLAQR